MPTGVMTRLELTVLSTEKSAMARFARKLGVSVGVLLTWSFSQSTELILTAVAEQKDNIIDRGEGLDSRLIDDIAWDDVGRTIAREVDPAL